MVVILPLNTPHDLNQRRLLEYVFFSSFSSTSTFLLFLLPLPPSPPPIPPSSLPSPSSSYQYTLLRTQTHTCYIRNHRIYYVIPLTSKPWNVFLLPVVQISVLMNVVKDYDRTRREVRKKKPGVVSEKQINDTQNYKERERYVRY